MKNKIRNFCIYLLIKITKKLISSGMIKKEKGIEIFCKINKYINEVKGNGGK